MNPYLFSLQNAQLTRQRHYDDTVQHYDVQAPNNAPRWTCADQASNVVYDTDIGYDSIYEDEEIQRGETSTAGMIHGALKNKSKDKEKVGKYYTFFDTI